MEVETMGDLDREFVRGLTLPGFDGVGTLTLRAWLGYWEAVRDGRQPPKPGEIRSMAPKQIRMIRSEIEMRERDGVRRTSPQQVLALRLI
jgi:hypothetical protein